MLASFPAVAKCEPDLLKSQHKIEFYFYYIVNIFFIEGTCQYSKWP